VPARRGGGHRLAPPGDLADQVVEQRQLEASALSAAPASRRLELAQLQRGEAHRAGQGLAMDEGLGEIALEQPVAMDRRGLDVTSRARCCGGS